MPGKLVCLADDLSKDAELYAEGNRLSVETECSSVKCGDLLVLYTHGQYDASNSATRKIKWFDSYKNAEKVADRLVDNDMNLKNVDNITLIVHACFSAGTRESPPTDSTNTFAGQLCSFLSDSIPGLTVIGLVGMTKAGRAGFMLNAGVEGRLPRSDPQAMDLWSVTYQTNIHGQVKVIKMGKEAAKIWDWKGKS
jgi:hypothetical protein